MEEDRLRSCVSVEEANAISAIPVSVTQCQDRLIWCRSKSGKYIVKRGYQIARRNSSHGLPSSASPSTIVSQKTWSILWNAPTAPKVKHFMWKVVNNWIATKDNLFKRKCAQSPLCPICYREPETVEHLLFRCPWTCNVWFGSGKLHWVSEGNVTAANRWIEDLLCGDLAKETTDDVMGEIFQLCWAIWLQRNAFVFTGKAPIPAVCIESAKKANMDYLNAMFKELIPKVSTPVSSSSWCPPPERSMKFNTDGAYSSSRSKAAFGVIARDSGGKAQWWYSGKVVASSALFIEAWALRITCIAAKDMDVRVAIFETDCLTLVRCIQCGSCDCDWEIYAIVKDILELSSSKEWSFVWCPRNNNRVAHWLAQSVGSRTPNFMYSDIPSGLFSVISSDVRNAIPVF